MSIERLNKLQKCILIVFSRKKALIEAHIGTLARKCRLESS